MLPPLVIEQMKKLRQLSFLTAIEARSVVPFDDLMKELDFSNIHELRNFISEAREQLGVLGVLCYPTSAFLVSSIPTLRRPSMFGQSLEVYLQAATVTHTDPQSGALYNEIVNQVKVPTSRCGKLFRWKSDFTSMGRGIFGQLVEHTTDGHLSQMSWNGLIFPGMFTILRGLLFLRPGAVPSLQITSQNSMNDYGSIEGMIERYAGLRFTHYGRLGKLEQTMYPIYSEDLRLHLKGKTIMPWASANQGIRALDTNYVTFLRCHPSLQTTSVRSVVFFHIRKQYKASIWCAHDFETALKPVRIRQQWVKNLRWHFLFKKVFSYAIDHRMGYKNEAADCQRCVHDWETHGREHLTAAERLIFTTEVLTYLVEHFFDDLYPHVLYVLLCGPANDMDLKAWLSKLPNLTVDITNVVQKDQVAS